MLIRAFGFLLRLYSYVFHLVLSAFLLGIASIAAFNHRAVDLRWLPFASTITINEVLSWGAIGFVVTLLAVTRVFKYFFPIWAAFVLYVLIRGFLFSYYMFDNAREFRIAIWVLFGALAAFFGAIWVVRTRRGRLWF